MNEKSMNTNKENYVVMHNDLIKSKSDLGLNEIKLLRLAIMQILKDDDDFQTYKITISDFAKLLGISKDNMYRDADEITTNLLKEVIYIGTNDVKKNWKKFQWVSECEYKNGVIIIKLHSNLKPYLLNLSQLYTQYVLEDILILKSVYSIRIYELLCQEMKYQKVYADKKANVYLTIEDIKKATNTEKKYNQNGIFKKKVVEFAINEINQKLKYKVTFSDVKESRKIIGFNFEIKARWGNYE